MIPDKNINDWLNDAFGEGTTVSKSSYFLSLYTIFFSDQNLYGLIILSAWTCA